MGVLGSRHSDSFQQGAAHQRLEQPGSCQMCIPVGNVCALSNGGRIFQNRVLWASLHSMDMKKACGLWKDQDVSSVLNGMETGEVVGRKGNFPLRGLPLYLLKKRLSSGGCEVRLAVCNFPLAPHSPSLRSPLWPLLPIKENQNESGPQPLYLSETGSGDGDQLWRKKSWLARSPTLLTPVLSWHGQPALPAGSALCLHVSSPS